MNHTLNMTSPRFADDVPALGLVSDVSVASSGQIVTGPIRYFLVPMTNVATIGPSKHLFGDPNRMSVASGRPVMEIHEFMFPADDFVRFREEENVVRHPTKEDRARRHIPTFLKEVYSLSQAGDTDTAGFKIFDFLDRVLIDGFFAICDEVLSKVDVEKIDTKLMRSFLSITAPAKKKLPSRGALYKKIEAKLLVLRGLEKTRRIIGSLA